MTVLSCGTASAGSSAGLAALRHAARSATVDPRMKANWGRGWILGCLVACLSATTAGCSDGEDGGGAPPPPTDMERGTMAATRQDTCGGPPGMDDGLSVFSSLGVMLSAFPAQQKRVVDCNLAAHDC